MTTLPANGFWENAARTQGEAKTWGDQIRDWLAQQPGGSTEASKVIAAGAITPDIGIQAVDTEAAAASDDLDTITQTNFPDGSVLLIRQAVAGRTVVVRHNIGAAGKILLADGANLSLNSTTMWLCLKRTGTTWEEVFRFYGSAVEAFRAYLKVETDIVAKAGGYTAAAADRGQLHDCNGTFTVSLTAAAMLANGWELKLRNSGTGLITIDPNSSEQIDGATTITLLPGESIWIVCDGAAFKTVARAVAGRWPVQAKTGAYTVVLGDRQTAIDCTSGTFTLSLTAAGTLGGGFIFGARNSGAGVITIDPNSSETIDGVTTITLEPGESCFVVCDGTNFKTIGKGAAAATQAQMEAAASNQVYSTPGRQHHHPLHLKAAAKIDSSSGTPTFGHEAGFSSITDHAAGDHTYNFDTAMSAANYAYDGDGKRISGAAGGATHVVQDLNVAPATGSCRMNQVTGSNVLTDHEYSVQFTGDL
jgi:nitrogen fixation protein